MSPLPRYLLKTQTDARLVALARAGHEPAFEVLVQRYRKPLLAYCKRLLLPESRAEDAIQQALLSAWSALGRGVEVTSVKAWLYRIVHNEAASALRRSGYDHSELNESLHGLHVPEEDLERRIAVREALAGLAELPDVQRDVLLRTAIDGQSHEQVALALGISDDAVRGMVYRARAAIRATATAFTPPPIALWVASTGGSGGRLAEVLASGGSAGLFGLLLKGGAVGLTAGGLATGAGLARAQHHAGRFIAPKPPTAAASNGSLPLGSIAGPTSPREGPRRSPPLRRDASGQLRYARSLPLALKRTASATPSEPANPIERVTESLGASEPLGRTVPVDGGGRDGGLPTAGDRGTAGGGGAGWTGDGRPSGTGESTLGSGSDREPNGPDTPGGSGDSGGHDATVPSLPSDPPPSPHSDRGGGSADRGETYVTTGGGPSPMGSSSSGASPETPENSGSGGSSGPGPDPSPR